MNAMRLILTSLFSVMLPVSNVRADCATQTFDKEAWFEAAGEVTTLPFADLWGKTFFVTDEYAEFGVLFTDGADFLHENRSYIDGVGLNGYENTVVMEFDPPVFWVGVDVLACDDFYLYSEGELVFDTSDDCFGGPGFIGVGSTWPLNKIVLYDPASCPCIDNLHISRVPVTIDCNDNRVADLIEVGWGCWSAPDCNINLIPDECDVADGIAEDCDDNGVLDDCEVSYPYTTSDTHAPFKGTLPMPLQFADEPLSGSDVEITITVSGDLDEFAEFMWVEFEGEQVTDFLFMEDGTLCADPPEEMHFTLTADEYHSYFEDDGEFQILIHATPQVDAASCPDGFVTAKISYFTLALADLDYDGVPDACQNGAHGDFNGDAGVDFSDLLALLAAWGPCAHCVEDLDDSGIVGFSDLLILLDNWS